MSHQLVIIAIGLAKFTVVHGPPQSSRAHRCDDCSTGSILYSDMLTIPLPLFFVVLDLGSIVRLPINEHFSKVPRVCLCDVGMAHALLQVVKQFLVAGCHGIGKHERCHQGPPHQPAEAALPPTSASRRILSMDGQRCWWRWWWWKRSRRTIS